MKFCVLPYDEFWSKLNEGQIAIALMAYAQTDIDNEDNRKKAYNGLLASLRSKGELCEHPSHNHPYTIQ